MKRILIWIVILAIAYFIIGYILVLIGWFEQSLYFNFSAIIGGVASVSGLLAFVISGIKRKDIEDIGIEYFKDVVKSAEELKNKENQLKEKEKELSLKEKELIELDIKKKELEFLVKKASMNLFLKDQFERTKKRILEIIEENGELKKLINQHKNLNEQIEALDLEIESSENVDLLRNIIDSVTENNKQRIGVEIGFNNKIIRLISESLLRIMN